MTSIQDKLDSYFQELASRNKFSGIVRVTQGEQELFSGAYGYAGRVWKVPNSIPTRFDPTDH